MGAPAAFDALLEQLEERELHTLTPADALARLDDLEVLVPAGDGGRDRRYRALRCDWGYDGDPEGQRAFALDGLARAREAGDLAAQARFHYCKAVAIETLGESSQEVMAAWNAGIEAARRSGNRRLLADGLGARGATHSLLDDQARAIPDLLAAMRLYRQSGFRLDAEWLLLDIGISYRRMGEFGKAREYLEQSEAFAADQGDWSMLVGSLMQQAYLAEDDGRLPEAIADYNRALALAEANDSPYDVASLRLAMAWPAIMEGEHRRALQLLDQADAGFAALEDRTNEDMVELRRGQARAGLGQHAAALSHYGRAATAMTRTGNKRYLAMLYLARARSAHALGQDAAAYADLERYVATHGRMAAAERSQQARLLREQFDNDRRDLENSRLANETALRERQVEALLAARRWQWTAMALGGVLVLLLVGLVVRQLARMRRLRELAATDPLTGVANRRSIERLGEEAIAAARLAHDGLCVLILDIDHFKQVNDRYGHLTGDQALARVANTCSAALRQFDQLGRTGGEEFLVLLPRTRMDQARQVAERIRAAVEALAFTDIDPALRLSVSIGVAELRDGDKDLRDLCGRADAALYAAKDAGRNRLVAAA
ncbi:MAG TPA: GGDEF domain-containing protein [Xanthomonadaceae bacterium]|nr:GGDEF domain-containing protein [Xanthomonadaceae bacterium]